MASAPGFTLSSPTVRRLVAPLGLAAPLMTILLVPAVVYGWASGQSADEADRAFRAGVTDADPVAIDPAFICDNAEVAPSNVTFDRLDTGDARQKTSLSALGFDRAVVETTGASSTATDFRFSFDLRRQDGRWCLHDVDISETAAPGAAIEAETT